MRTTIFRGLAAASLLVSTAACGAARHPADTAADPNAPAVVTFRNNSMDLADVYAVGRGTTPFRIATVASGQTANVALPRALTAGAGSVQLIARPLATRRLIGSGPVTVFPGDHLNLTFESAGNMISVLPGD